MIINCKNINLDIDFDKISGDENFRKILIERLKNEEWESKEAKYIDLIPRNSKLLELGGCIGFISCLSNSLLSDKTRHVVFEANTNIIATLSNNKKINNAQFNIENAILSDKTGFANFYIDKRSVLGSTQCKIPSERIMEKLTIPTITLDDLEKKYGFEFDALICDIEGGEYALFENEITDDKLKKFNFISLEFHWNVDNSKERYKLILNRLINLNFKITNILDSTGQRQVFGIK